MFNHNRNLYDFKYYVCTYISIMLFIYNYYI